MLKNPEIRKDRIMITSLLFRLVFIGRDKLPRFYQYTLKWRIVAKRVTCIGEYPI